MTDQRSGLSGLASVSSEETWNERETPCWPLPSICTYSLSHLTALLGGGPVVLSGCTRSVARHLSSFPSSAQSLACLLPLLVFVHISATSPPFAVASAPLTSPVTLLQSWISPFSEPFFPVHAGRVCVRAAIWKALEGWPQKKAEGRLPPVAGRLCPNFSCPHRVFPRQPGDVVSVVKNHFLCKVEPEWAAALLQSVPPHRQGPDPSAFTLSPQRQDPDPSAFTISPQRQGPDPSAFTFSPQRQDPDPSAFTFSPHRQGLGAITISPNRQSPDPSAFTFSPYRQGPDPSAFTFSPYRQGPDLSSLTQGRGRL
jgi:hypothetical protein